MADVGTQMVDSLYEQMMIDDQWAVRRERGFTWWAYRLAQHVEVGPPIQSGDLEVCVLRIWTEVARNVDPAMDPPALLGVVNMQTTLSALVWDESAGSVTECCTAVVHDENIGWLGKILATTAILQNTSAHSRAHAIAENLKGTPAASQHPTGGPRPEMDDMLKMPEQVIVPMGAEPSRFIGPPCEGLGQFAVNYGWFGTFDATGGVVEVPYTGERPLIMQPADSPDTTAETALVQIFTDQPHPEAGNGALVVMRLPVSPGADRAAALANKLNDVESQGDLSAPLLGAWCPDAMSTDGNGLAFCCFVPNLLAQPGILENQIIYQAARAQFALAQLTS